LLYCLLWLSVHCSISVGCAVHCLHSKRGCPSVPQAFAHIHPDLSPLLYCSLAGVASWFCGDTHFILPCLSRVGIGQVAFAAENSSGAHLVTQVHCKLQAETRDVGRLMQCALVQALTLRTYIRYSWKSPALLPNNARCFCLTARKSSH
jgi:hypothetical protein